MSDKLLEKTYHGTLEIVGLKIPCVVLEDETRVLRERSVAKALGKKGGGAHWQRKKAKNGAVLPEYISTKNLQPFIEDDVREQFLNPISYKHKSGNIVQGLPATLLPEICNIWLKARENGALYKNQEMTAKKAEILMRGFATVGIIALVDEATGYQEVRIRRALQQIFDKFIAKELRPYVKTFDLEFYRQIFRLNRWPYTEESIKKRPGVVGRWTNDIIYDRLAPGLRIELHRIAERRENGKLKHKLFQHLSDEIGSPKLKEHLVGVITLMQASSSWRTFYRLLQRAKPKIGETGDMFADHEG